MVQNKRMIGLIILVKLVSVGVLVAAVSASAAPSAHVITAEREDAEKPTKPRTRGPAAISEKNDNEAAKECVEGENSQACLKKMGRQIATTKSLKSYYKTTPETGLQNFGVDLLDKMSQPRQRAPASR